jgi:glutathione synthase/RimK-type ligase-like ATP-grasp enzyme
MILIVSSRSDVSADSVEDGLRARGADVVRFDPGDFPSRAALSISYRRGGGWCRVIDRDGEPSIDLDRVRAVWLRRPTVVRPPAELEDERVRRYLTAEWTEIVSDLLASLTCPWVPGPYQRVLTAQRKAYPLLVAERLGFRIPDSALTSRPDDLFALHRAHAGNVITKPPEPTALPVHFREHVRYTERLSPRELGHARALRWSPLMVQENIDKALELRVTIVGERVFTAAIDSQATHRTRQDWRRYDHANTPYRAHELPAEIAARCVTLTAALGLRYGAIDLILTPEGEHVFLEINPAGEYGWVEEGTSLPITDALCDLLVEVAA